MEDLGPGTNTLTLKPATLTSSFSLTLPDGTGNSNQVLSTDGLGNLFWNTGISGPLSSTDNSIVRWDGTSGKVIQDSIPQITDTGDITNVGGYFGASMVLTGTANAVQHTTTGTAVMNGDDITGISLLELGTAKTIFISKESDLPASVGGFHPLVPNTSYVITNQINMVDGIEFKENTSISGYHSSKLIFQNTVTAFKALDENVQISNLVIEGGGDNATGLCDFRNINYSGIPPFYDRTKRCEIVNVEFINFFNLGIIDGFAINNISNCIISGSSILQNPLNGFIMTNSLSMEFNDNKLLLFQGFSSPSSGSLLKLGSNTTYNVLGENIGFRSVVINSNIMNPRDLETGIEIETGFTTENGIISGNTFVREGGTGPFINYQNQANFDNYNPTEVKNLTIESNNGILESNPVCKIDFLGNTQATPITLINVYSDLNPPTSTIQSINLNTHIGVNLTVTITVPFTIDEIITGSTSGSQARIVDVVSPTEYYIVDSTGSFSDTENLTGDKGGSGSITSGVNGINLKIKYLDPNPRKLFFTFSSQLSQVTTINVGWEVAFLFNGVNNDCSGTIEVIRFNRPGTLNVVCIQKLSFGDTVSIQIRNLDSIIDCLVRRGTFIVGSY